jgi:hypothetical protein
MSAITSEWSPVATEAPTTRAVKHTKKYSREEEFRSALEHYIAGYQERWSRTIGPADCDAHKTYLSFYRKFAGWIGHWSPRCRGGSDGAVGAHSPEPNATVWPKAERQFRVR